MGEQKGLKSPKLELLSKIETKTYQMDTNLWVIVGEILQSYCTLALSTVVSVFYIS